jgi:hypothetical protein
MATSFVRRVRSQYLVIWRSKKLGGLRDLSITHNSGQAKFKTDLDIC